MKQDSKNLSGCRCGYRQCPACLARARISRAAMVPPIDERTSGDTQVANAYRKGSNDAIWLAGVLLACASVVCMLGMQP